MERHDLLNSRYIPLGLWYPRRSKSKRGPNGRALCRRCGIEVPKRRRQWCSDECETEALVVCGYSTAIHYALLRRDNGVCQACGLECERLRDIMRYWYHDEHQGHQPKMLRANLQAGGYDCHNSLWQAHHIIPVEHGGARLGSSNLVTLCQLCHLRAHNPARPHTGDFIKSNFPILIPYFAHDFSASFPKPNTSV